MTIVGRPTECRMCLQMLSEPVRPEELKRREIEEKLIVVERELRAQMLARGFDPAQYDHLALTAPLAKLYTERENLKMELEALESGSEE